MLTAFTRGAVVAIALALAAAVPAAAQEQPISFTTPSGNIACEITLPVADIAPGVRCDIGEFTYTPPPAPADCHVVFGHSVILQQGQAPQFGCAHDTMVGSHFPVLQYGATARLGSLECDSTDRGLVCTDDTSGHSFRLARESYDLK